MPRPVPVGSLTPTSDADSSRGSCALVYVAALAVTPLVPYLSLGVFATSVVVFALAGPGRSAAAVQARRALAGVRPALDAPFMMNRDFLT